MTEGRNIAISIGLLLIIGITVPVVVGWFYDIDSYSYSPSGISGALYNFVDGGITLDILVVSWDIIDVETANFIQERLVGYSIFVDEVPLLANSILILINIVLFYNIIKLIRG